MRSAPTLKIWITPFASVAMLDKVGAVEDRALQRAGFKQGFLVQYLGDALFFAKRPG
jgi:hypothetical protein